MDFERESDFEAHARGILSEMLPAPDFDVLTHKTVGDIVICRNRAPASIYFIEVKYFSPSKSRLGFGNGRGEGTQPEMLIKQPIYLEQNVQWLIGSSVHGDGYWLVSSEQIREHLAGDSIGKKQNNIRESLCRDNFPSGGRSWYVKSSYAWAASKNQVEADEGTCHLACWRNPSARTASQLNFVVVEGWRGDSKSKDDARNQEGVGTWN